MYLNRIERRRATVFDARRRSAASASTGPAPRTHRPGRPRRHLVVLLTVAALLTSIPASAGNLPGRRFGPGVDPAPGYVGQTYCDPYVKPGVAAFRRMVMRSFPDTGAGYFIRACSIGGRSEHKDGRAWDWMVSAASAADRRRVGKVMDWLLRKDARGNRHAHARRIGLMYMIWNRRIWSHWSGWQPYSGASPHTDHVHFSFSWPGARKRTTFWNRRSSFVVGAASHPTARGLWAVTGNSHVLTAGASSFHGDRSNVIGSGAAAAIAPTPSGDGYWMARKSGKVLAFGGAPRRGSFKGEGLVVDIEPTPRGNGYWIVTRSGRVAAFGNAEHFGNLRADVRITGMAATPNGRGYWLASGGGEVFRFGNAQPLGELEGSRAITSDIEAAPQQGYWLVSRGGRVSAFGSAAFEGDLRSRDLVWPVTSIVSTPNGAGYWLVDEGGRARAFGNAPAEETRHRGARLWNAPAPTPNDAGDPSVEPRYEMPADPAPDEDLLIRDFLQNS